MIWETFLLIVCIPYCQKIFDSLQSIQSNSYRSYLPSLICVRRKKDEVYVQQKCCKNVKIVENEVVILFQEIQSHSKKIDCSNNI